VRPRSAFPHLSSLGAPLPADREKTHRILVRENGTAYSYTVEDSRESGFAASSQE